MIVRLVLKVGALPPKRMCRLWSSQYLLDCMTHMCSTFSVCSKRFSVIMMSTTSCNLLLASFGAASSTVRFHPLGVLSNGIILPVSFLYATRTMRPETDPLSLLCHGFDSHQGSSHLCWSRFNGHKFTLYIFGHKQASTFIPHNGLASWRVRHSSSSVPVTSVPSCSWMQCRHHGSAHCRVDSKRDLSATRV